MSATIKAIFLSILLSFSFQAYSAENVNFNKCGYIDNSDQIDGDSGRLCTENKTVMLKTAFFGDMTQSGMQEGVDIDSYDSRFNSYSPAIQSFILKTNKIVSNAVKFVYDWMWIFGVISLIQIPIKSLMDHASGDFLERYDWRLMVGVPLLYIAVCLPFIGPGANYSLLSYLVSYSDNHGMMNEQRFINNQLATQQRAGLEVNKPKLTTSTQSQLDKAVKQDEITQSKQTYGMAENIIDGLSNKSMFEAVNSRIVNTIFSKKNGVSVSTKIFNDPAMTIKALGTDYEFKTFNPEDPSVVVYQSGLITIPNAYYKASSVFKTLTEIGYFSEYGNNDDISQAKTRSDQLAEALKNAPSLVNREGEYRAVINTAKTIYYTDLRANWIRNKVPELIGETFKLNMLALNAICADNKAIKIRAEYYIKDEGGSVDCVGEGKTLMGTDTAENYQKAYVVARKALVDSLYADLMELNTSYMEAMQTEQLSKMFEQTINCGAFCFMNNYRTLRNLTAYQTVVLKNFNATPFIGLFETNAKGNFLGADYAQTIGREVESELPIENYLKDQLKVVSAGLPIMDGDAVVQKAIVQNGISGGQDNDLLKANGLNMELPDVQFKRMLMSDQDVVRSYYIYCQSVLETASKTLTVGLTIKAAAITGISVLEIKQNGTKNENTATVGKVKKGKGKNSGFDFQSYLIGLDGIADLLMNAVLYATLFAISGMYLILTVTSYIPELLYILSKLWVCFSIVFVVLGAVTALRANDLNNLTRIRNNTVAILMMPWISGTAILAMFVINVEISSIVTQRVLLIVYMYMGDMIGGFALNKYIMLIVILNVSIYCIQLTSLTFMLDMIGKSFKRLGIDKHSSFVSMTINSLDSMVAILNLMTMGGYRLGQNFMGSLISRFNYKRFIKS
jgi:hypothetical protein